jgi:hypothetical protein
MAYFKTMRGKRPPPSQPRSALKWESPAPFRKVRASVTGLIARETK